MKAERRALFLDRDGTVIVDAGYTRRPEDVRLLDGAAVALAEAASLGYALVVVSNQSGVGRGYFTEAELDRVHARMVELLAEHGVALDGAFYCLHAPQEDCACRKPKPEMLERAARELGLDLARSAMIGDKASDVEAGLAAGCAAFLLGEGEGATWADAMAWLRTK